MRLGELGLGMLVTCGRAVSLPWGSPEIGGNCGVRSDPPSLVIDGGRELILHCACHVRHCSESCAVTWLPLLFPPPLYAARPCNPPWNCKKVGRDLQDQPTEPSHDCPDRGPVARISALESAARFADNFPGP